MATLLESLEVQIKPVILVDLFFDSGTISIWTRPFTGEFENVIYSPIAGLTGALAIRQSLDQPSLSLAAEINGSSAEIESAGLTEEFQLRDARIRMSNVNAAGGMDDPEVLIEGVMQDIPIIDSASDSNVVVQIEGLFSEINRATGLRLSAADQVRFDSGDSFFNFVETVGAGPRFGD